MTTTVRRPTAALAVLALLAACETPNPYAGRVVSPATTPELFPNEDPAYVAHWNRAAREREAEDRIRRRCHARAVMATASLYDRSLLGLERERRIIEAREACVSLGGD